jgi:hypothetical protein
VDEQLRDVGAVRLVRWRREDDLDRAHDLVAPGTQRAADLVPRLDLDGPCLELWPRASACEKGAM